MVNENELNRAKDKLQESIKLARECGVPEDKILHNLEEIDRYFNFKRGEGI